MRNVSKHHFSEGGGGVGGGWGGGSPSEFNFGHPL